MAVTVTYSFELRTTLEFATGPAVRDIDAVGLTNGGLAVVGEQSNLFSALEVLNGSLLLTGSRQSFALSDPVVTQLSDGNLAILSRTGDNHGVLDIVTQTGQDVVDGLLITSEDGAANNDIAALTGGGFVVVMGDITGPSFIRVELRNNAGTFLTGFNFVAADEQDFFKPAVAGLDDGGFAIAWEQDNGDIWYAVYNANGSVRLGPTVFDTGVNANVSITATDTGFAIAYEDFDHSSNADIGLGTFDASGNFLDFVTLSGNPTIDEAPHITRMPDGLIGVAFGISLVAPADSETYIQLYDPATRTVVASRIVLAGQPVTDDTDLPAIVGYGGGRAAVFHYNATDGDADGEALEVIRTSTGDGSNDAVFGNSYIDIMHGGAGADFMNGLANNDTLNGDAGDDIMLGGTGNDILNGGAGIDTASYTNAAGGISVSLLLAGAQNVGGGQGNDTISLVENILGSGFADTLTGNNGNNRLDGLFGNDTLRGGLGSDVYGVNSAADAVIELANAGEDTIETSLSTFSLAAIANVERLTYIELNTFVGQGNALANRIQGGIFNDRFLVDAGGNDAFIGLDGTDIMDFRTSAAGATINLTTNAHGGAALGDSFSSIETFYGSNTAVDTMTGNAAANRFEGFGGNDNLSGLAGNDALLGGNGNDTMNGGTGIDSMSGGIGNDTYIVDHAADATIESASAGTDNVQASIAHTLRVNVENLVLTGSGNINGTGNTLANTITGNSGSNILNGLTGADSMTGLAGNDTYYVDSAADTTIEAAGAGIDIVRSSVNHTLGANIEKLYLLAGAQNGSGNTLSNFIYGNTLGNTLNGFAGADRLSGLQGNDTYIVDSAGDLVFETIAGAAGGTDTVQSSVNHTLATNVENLTLTAGTNINGTGNTLANVIVGGSGNNFIDGKLGNDTLTGGLGNDQFLFSTTLGASNIDTITDFSVPNDTIRLDDAVFTGLTAGNYITAAQFTIGAAAADADDRIIYNSTTGALFFDADGNGAGAAKQFATLSAGLALTTTDFYAF
jgi:Ca2+-binding RTX toxin-like protein